MAVLKKKKEPALALVDETEGFENYWEQVRKAEKAGMPVPPRPPGTEPEVPLDWKEQKKDAGLGFFAKWKIKRKPETTYLVSMEFSNGTTKTWVIEAKGETFRYRGRMYYLRFEDSRYDVTQSMQKLIYHEDYAVPISKEIIPQQDITEDNKEDSESAKAYFAVTPHNLKHLLKMEYVKVLAQSQELSKYLKAVTVLSVLIILLMVGNLYLTLKGRGSI